MRAKLLINQKKKSKNIYLYFPRYKLGVNVMLSKLEAIVLNIQASQLRAELQTLRSIFSQPQAIAYFP